MSSAGPGSSRKASAAAGVAGVLALAALVALSRRLPPDGGQHGSLEQFIGRFHPALVHLPIALLLLVPVLEIVGRLGRRQDLRSAAGFVLALAALSALATALDGWLLAWSGGYSGPLVMRHLRWGTGFAACCLAALAGRQWLRPGGWRAALYSLLLAGSLVLMVIASDYGGRITHGDRYLSEFMPPRLRSWLGIAPPPPPRPRRKIAPAERTLYATQIQPIFDRSCVSCHNPRKAKGGLLLDNYADLMKGADDGPVVDPWHPQPDDSELVRRITLPPDDDDFMPNNGRNLLTPAQKALIERWIADGATANQPAQ